MDAKHAGGHGTLTIATTEASRRSGRTRHRPLGEQHDVVVAAVGRTIAELRRVQERMRSLVADFERQFPHAKVRPMVQERAGEPRQVYWGQAYYNPALKENGIRAFATTLTRHVRGRIVAAGEAEMMETAELCDAQMRELNELFQILRDPLTRAAKMMRAARRRMERLGLGWRADG